MHYLDTSVLAAYYCPDARSAEVQGLLARIEGPTISPLVEVELHCAVARKVRAGEMDARAARRVFAQFQVHVAEPRFYVVPVREADCRLAREWIARLASPLRVLDTLHLAVAYARGLRMLTADEQLARSAKLLGVECRLISR